MATLFAFIASGVGRVRDCASKTYMKHYVVTNPILFLTLDGSKIFTFNPVIFNKYIPEKFFNSLSTRLKIQIFFRCDMKLRQISYKMVNFCFAQNKPNRYSRFAIVLFLMEQQGERLFFCNLQRTWLCCHTLPEERG